MKSQPVDEIETAPLPKPRSTKSARGKSAINFIFLLAVLVPPGAILFFIHRYGVNLPYWDEWDTLDLVVGARSGRLTLSSLWVQHNEHRLFVVNIASVLLGNWTHYNLIASMYCGFVFELLALILVWRILTLSLRGAEAALARPLTVCASFLLFWSVPIENWTWGISAIEFLGGILWAVAAIWALVEWPLTWRATFLAFLFAVLAVLTSGAGFAVLLIFPVGIVMLGRRQGKTQWVQLAVYTLASASLLVLFFRGWRSIPTPRTSEPLERLVVGAAYFFAFLGSPFDSRYGWKLAMLAGLAGAACFAFSVRRLIRSLPRVDLNIFLPWILLALYSVVNAALTAYGRSGFGLEQAMSSRYASIAVLFWLSTLVIVSTVIFRSNQQSSLGRAARACLVALALFSGIVYVQAYYKSLLRLRYHSLIMKAALKSVREYRTASDRELEVLHPSAARVREMSQQMERYHIGPFAD